jgi:RecA/RadA recombinase
MVARERLQKRVEGGSGNAPSSQARVKPAARAKQQGNYFSSEHTEQAFIHSGCTTLDLALGGGWAQGRISNVIGDKCLSGDTIVSVQRGIRPRKMTIETLYKRVNGSHPNRNAKAETKLLADLGGYVGMQRMVSVQKTGSKILYKVIADDGESIQVSQDHKFKTDDGWKTIASGLQEGSQVHCWRGKQTGRQDRPDRAVTYSIPYHPYGWQHLAAGRNYKRMMTARLIIEAAMNNITLEDFIRILRSNPDEASKLAYSDYDMDVHHLDCDPLNNDLGNLELITSPDHWDKHADDMRRGTNRTVICTIKSIKRLKTSPTYDITMEDPHNNFIADGFVVHNSSGKSLLMIESCANFAIKYPRGKIRYRECESAFDKPYAGALGMPLDRVDFGKNQLDTVEDFFEDLGSVIDKAAGPELYILDSLDSLSDRTELSKDIDQGSYGMEKAKKMSQLFRRLVRQMAAADVTLLIVSQVRSKIGVTFGSKTTRAGGRALDFYASQVVFLSQIGTISKVIKKISRPVALEVKAKVSKNKVSLPFREAKFNIVFGFGVDDTKSSLDWLKESGGVPTDLPDVLTEKDWLEALQTDKHLQQKLRKAVTERWFEIENGFLLPYKKYGD